ncbi:MAG TPA: bifunctional polysaccharide deacetylase/glycosyltransferase family 2 protein [Gaiellaceae bacterium]|nr:bifunctional polysaccharide deacetylase/glycosyltransferase family 2 protein [Gaiellaceae bacterium]
MSGSRAVTRWVVLGLLLTTLLVLLAVQGLSTRTTGRSATPVPGNGGPQAGEGAVLAWGAGGLQSRDAAPGKHIALTFDDGPDPKWTPKIAGALERLHVPATFFVVGSEVVRHPDVVRQLHRAGFEIGNHTFTHADVSTLPGWERRLQVSLTDNALAGTVGIRPRLFRPPYSSVPGGVNVDQARTYEHLARDGYDVVLTDYDGEDWRRPGVDSIVAAATPQSGRGGIVLLHDGGGDRSETVRAVERLVPALRARGFRFVTVSQLAGLPRDQAEVPVEGWGRARGRILIATLAVARWTTTILAWLLVAVALLFVARVFLLLLFARRHARAVRSRAYEEGFAPPVSVIVPAFNEVIGIERSIRSLADSDYPELEVIVVDDGSTDGTGDLVQSLELSRVRVLHQPNSGKPAALNRGIDEARHDLVVMVDADTVFEPRTLAHLVQPFRSADVGAVSGNTKVGNRKRLLGRWQHIEYVMGFNLDRRLFDVLRCMPTVPGAIGAFRREALADAGGVSGDTLAEDTDLTLAVGRAGWRVVYEENARAWTEAPATLRGLWRQRYRWCYGTLQSVWKHRAAFWRLGERAIGRRGLPYLVLFQIVLPLFAPLIDLFSIYGIVFLDPWAVLGFWCVFTSLQLLLGWYAFRLDRESPRVLWAMPLQQFVYRQLMYLVVVESVLTAIQGSRLHWRPIARSGEIEVKPS